MTRVACILVLSLFSGVHVLEAQSATDLANDLLGQGVRRYQALEYDAAAALLTRSLGLASTGALADSQRTRALTYLAATELFRGQRDSAVTAFREVVLLNPRYHPDELIFPPQVTNLFQEVRRTTRAIAVVVPPVTQLRTRLERFSAQVLTSSLADVTVTLVHADGSPLRELYNGPVVDSLLVTWDGLTAPGGAPADDGRYILRVAPRTPGPDAPRAREVMLDVKQQLPDTLPWPPPLTSPPLLPERTSGGPAIRSLATGLLAGAAVMALPAIIAPDRDTQGGGSGARIVVGAAVGVSGIVGFFARKPRPLEANVRANASQRDAWKRKVEAVRAENATRLQKTRLEVRAGPVTIADRGGAP
jgi:hypothetical protein